jgi:hypothetical protein
MVFAIHNIRVVQTKAHKIEQRDSHGGIQAHWSTRGETGGRTGVVGKLRCAGAATVKNPSQAGKRPELIGFPPQW